MRLLVIDNYDSFTYNLVQYLGELGMTPLVYRNDTLRVPQFLELEPDAILLSPGPKTPYEAGVSLPLIEEAAKLRLPVFGVCLGMQSIACAFGAKLMRAPELVHGKASPIWHDGSALFRDLPNPFWAGRYHSLVVDPATLPDELVVSAWTQEGLVMGLRHRYLPIEGVQFHPESRLSPQGKQLLRNFLEQLQAFSQGAVS